MPHKHRIYATAADMDMAKMCEYPPSQHALPHCKYVLHCCDSFPWNYLPYQEWDRHHSIISTSIRVHIYNLIAHCTVHGRINIEQAQSRITIGTREREWGLNVRLNWVLHSVKILKVLQKHESGIHGSTMTMHNMITLKSFGHASGFSIQIYNDTTQYENTRNILDTYLR